MVRLDARLAQLIGSLENGPYLAAWDAERALVHIGEPAVVPLLLAFAQIPPQGQNFAARALGKIGDPRAVTLLMEALRFDSGKEDDCIEWYAAEALTRIGEPALAPLIAALADNEGHTRKWSAVALGEMADPLAVEPLLDVARTDAVQAVRFCAIIALGQIGDQRAIEPLVALIGDPDFQVRMHAVGSLGWCVKGGLFEPLVKLLDDPTNLRIAAIHALAISAGTQAIDLLIQKLEDGDACVRSAAIAQLGRLGAKRALPLLHRIEQSDGGQCGDGSIQAVATFSIKRIMEQPDRA